MNNTLATIMNLQNKYRIFTCDEIREIEFKNIEFLNTMKSLESGEVQRANVLFVKKNPLFVDEALLIATLIRLINEGDFDFIHSIVKLLDKLELLRVLAKFFNIVFVERKHTSQMSTNETFAKAVDLIATCQYTKNCNEIHAEIIYSTWVFCVRSLAYSGDLMKLYMFHKKLKSFDFCIEPEEYSDDLLFFHHIVHESKTIEEIIEQVTRLLNVFYTTFHSISAFRYENIVECTFHVFAKRSFEDANTFLQAMIVNETFICNLREFKRNECDAMRWNNLLTEHYFPAMK